MSEDVMIGQAGKYNDHGEWEENGEAVQFTTWWNRIKGRDKFLVRDKDGKVIGNILDKYDPYTLYPVFYEYAAFRMVDCSYAQLWSTIRVLSGRLSYPHYPFYKAWLLYWKVAMGALYGDRHNGHRLEFARNYCDLRNRPLMVFIRTIGIRYEFLRKRVSTRLEMRRIWNVYNKQNKLKLKLKG
jgi:hypothetical protein